MKTGKILISACLIGQKVRYDGRCNRIRRDIIAKWQQSGLLVPICPEVTGGLPTPRNPAELQPGKTASDILSGKGRILDNTGTDVTDQFVIGAKITLDLAIANNCRYGLMKEASPSCGCNYIHSGKFDGQTKIGKGITAALLQQNGIEIFSETGIEKLVKAISDSKINRLKTQTAT